MKRALPAAGLGLLLLAISLPALACGGKGELVGVANLNEATAGELQLLPGVGPRMAENILGFRQRQRFRRVEDLVRVKGFGRTRVRRLRPFLSVKGPTTLVVVKGGARARGRPDPRQR